MQKGNRPHRPCPHRPPPPCFFLFGSPPLTTDGCASHRTVVLGFCWRQIASLGVGAQRYG
jgi:hypothetical protein